MGTKNTMQFKIEAVNGLISRIAKNKKDILIEKTVSHLMLRLFCERRKALELLRAVISQFPYKEGKIDGEKAYLYDFEDKK